MKLKKLLEINQMCEERKLPFDIEEPYIYNSSGLGETNILDMDIVHFIRAFKLLNGSKNPTIKTDKELYWISDRLTGLAKELEGYTDER